MSREKRKYPRFDVNLDVLFYNSQRTRGKLINISKKGCMLTTEKGVLRSVGSMVTFRVFFSGKAQLLEGTSPQISMKDIAGASRRHIKDEHAPDLYPNAVKIIAKVARHVEHNGTMAMGIELLDLDGPDAIKWTAQLAQMAKDKIVMPFTGVNEVTQPRIEPMSDTYTIRFKSLDHAIRYIPRDPKALFFIPSKSVRQKGELIKILMVHPENKTDLHFNAIVEGYGPNPKNDKILGIYFRYESFSQALKIQINTFLGQYHFSASA